MTDFLSLKSEDLYRYKNKISVRSSLLSRNRDSIIRQNQRKEKLWDAISVLGLFFLTVVQSYFFPMFIF